MGRAIVRDAKYSWWTEDLVKRMPNFDVSMRAEISENPQILSEPTTIYVTLTKQKRWLFKTNMVILWLQSHHEQFLSVVLNQFTPQGLQKPS